MMEDLKQAGTWHDSREELKIPVKTGASSSAQCLKVAEDTESGPEALCGFSLLNSLFTSSSWTERAEGADGQSKVRRRAVLGNHCHIGAPGVVDVETDSSTFRFTSGKFPLSARRSWNPSRWSAQSGVCVFNHVSVKHNTLEEEKSLFLLISSAISSILLESERTLERKIPGSTDIFNKNIHTINRTASQGETVVFHCNNSEDEEDKGADVVWRKEEILLFNYSPVINQTVTNYTSSRMYVDPNNPLKLQISDVQPSDAGAYTCFPIPVQWILTMEVSKRKPELPREMFQFCVDSQAVKKEPGY
ncbi:uncharacterized protein LOC108423841 [Pygocentrus nattereri]|uniref:uncharacterized protein LOC108423841 n=1 Tax=Pygocentrus nattereri TaxID=42514 RepID=UPI001890F8AE|nr:uncharacterized protein LOC108423841 [Pygocentrus nattereri]